MTPLPDSLFAFQCMFPDDNACAAWRMDMRSVGSGRNRRGQPPPSHQERFPRRRNPGFVFLKRTGCLDVFVEGAGLVLVHPDSDQGAGEVVAMRQAVEGLAGEKLLNDLAPERNAVASVSSVLGHRRRSFECPAHRSSHFKPPVPPQGPTPIGGQSSKPIDNNLRVDRSNGQDHLFPAPSKKLRRIKRLSPRIHIARAVPECDQLNEAIHTIKKTFLGPA